MALVDYVNLRAPILPLLLSTRQRQNDISGGNDADDNTHDCRDSVSLQRGSRNIAVSHL
jgi:hypothetical protein